MMVAAYLINPLVGEYPYDAVAKDYLGPVSYTHLDVYKRQELAKEDAADNDVPFYRVEDTGRLTKNDDTRYGYASGTHFSSLMNINVSHFYQALYMEGGKNFYCYNGATPVTSAMLLSLIHI